MGGVFPILGVRILMATIQKLYIFCSPQRLTIGAGILETWPFSPPSGGPAIDFLPLSAIIYQIRILLSRGV